MPAMLNYLSLSSVRGLGGALVLCFAASFAVGAASCGSNAVSCIADSVCHPACASDPDCAGSGQGGQSGAGSGGITGAAGSPGSAGTTSTGIAGTTAAAGTTGTAGTTGAAGITGAAGTGGQACGTATVAGQVSFTGVSDIAFNVVRPTVQHKRDIDQFEDGCFNQLDFSFGYAAGCTLRVLANNCLDAQGRLKVQSVMFTADSQCPNFPDATEGAYTGNAAAVEGSWVAMSMSRIAERNVATSCTSVQFSVTLAGTLTASGSRTLTMAAGSTLTVSGQFVSNARDAVCPTTCTTGGGGRGGTGGAGGRGGAGGTTGTTGPCLAANLEIAQSTNNGHFHLPLPATGPSSEEQLASQINTGTPLTFTLPFDPSGIAVGQHNHVLNFSSSVYATLRNHEPITGFVSSTVNSHSHEYLIWCRATP
jgi:hypothetical protein